MLSIAMLVTDAQVKHLTLSGTATPSDGSEPTSFLADMHAHLKELQTINPKDPHIDDYHALFLASAFANELSVDVAGKVKVVKKWLALKALTKRCGRAQNTILQHTWILMRIESYFLVFVS